jgi:acetyltransferase
VIRIARTHRRPLTIRPLGKGDTATIEALFEQLGERSRRYRFGVAKPKLTPGDLELLARINAHRHTLVAYANRTPVGIAHLVHDDDDPTSAEVALAVADNWHRLGIGTALARVLTVDAQAAGISRVHATIHVDNQASLALMRDETTVVSSRIERDTLWGAKTGVPALKTADLRAVTPN